MFVPVDSDSHTLGNYVCSQIRRASVAQDDGLPGSTEAHNPTPSIIPSITPPPSLIVALLTSPSLRWHREPLQALASALSLPPN
eukprot:764748-Hanusia_phi.AAC.2